MHKRIPTGIVILSLLALIVMRLLPVWVESFQVLEQLDRSPIGEWINNGIQLNKFWSAGISFIYAGLIALISITTLGKIWIPDTNKLGLLLSVVFFLSVGYQIQQISVAYLIPIFVLLSFAVIYQNKEKRITQFTVFNLFLLIGFASVISGYFLLLIPFYFLSLFFFYKLNLKEILAGIIGLIVPYWMVFGVSFYVTGSNDYFKQFFEGIDIRLINIEEIPPGFAIYIPAITLYTIIAVANDFKNYSSVSIQKRNLFITSNLLVMYSFIMYAITVFPLYVSILTSAVPFGLLFSSYLQNNTRVRSTVYFIVLISSILFSFVLEF